MAKCDCYFQHGTKFLCYGTKEMEECSCGGDESKCNFYPEKRKLKMATEKRLIDANALKKNKTILWDVALGFSDCVLVEDIDNAPTVDAYTEEQVDSIIQKADLLEIENRNLQQEVDWLKNCLNCEIRNKCPRHCGKVVHGCDHWIDGDPVVHGRWKFLNDYQSRCSECHEIAWVDHDNEPNYCPNCGANMMDGDGNG